MYKQNSQYTQNPLSILCHQETKVLINPPQFSGFGKIARVPNDGPSQVIWLLGGKHDPDANGEGVLLLCAVLLRVLHAVPALCTVCAGSCPRSVPFSQPPGPAGCTRAVPCLARSHGVQNFQTGACGRQVWERGPP